MDIETELANFTKQEQEQKEKELRRKRHPGAPKGTPVPALRMVRLFRDMTQIDLERVSGVSRQTVSNLEDGSGAKAQTIRKLAEALDVQPETLVRDFGNLEGHIEDEDEDGES